MRMTPSYLREKVGRIIWASCVGGRACPGAPQPSKERPQGSHDGYKKSVSGLPKKSSAPSERLRAVGENRR